MTATRFDPGILDVLIKVRPEQTRFELDCFAIAPEPVPLAIAEAFAFRPLRGWMER